MKKIAFLLLSICFIASCNEVKKTSPSEEKTTEKKEEVAANYKSVEVDIEGMTCEIGCARTIESKLSKVDGVIYSKVDFEHKKGVFTFDTNKLSNQDITNKIEGIAGGDLYFVTKINDLEEIFKKNK